jgi:ribosome recycling factor
MPMNSIINECKSKMDKAVSVLQDELKGFRTGRASPALVENIRVDYYGTMTPMKGLASISAPQPDSLMIKPFDAGAVGAIEKAIKTSDLSIAPILEGKFIRLNIPPLSEERRKQTVKVLKDHLEQHKVALRNIRKDTLKHVAENEGKPGVSEDALKQSEEEIQSLTKKYEEQLDSAFDKKSKEVLTV